MRERREESGVKAGGRVDGGGTRGRKPCGRETVKGGRVVKAGEEGEGMLCSREGKDVGAGGRGRASATVIVVVVVVAVVVGQVVL